MKVASDLADFTLGDRVLLALHLSSASHRGHPKVLAAHPWLKDGWFTAKATFRAWDDSPSSPFLTVVDLDVPDPLTGALAMTIDYRHLTHLSAIERLAELAD